MQLILCQLDVGDWRKEKGTPDCSWKRGLPWKFARFVLFRLIKKRSFNLLCVLDLKQEEQVHSEDSHSKADLEKNKQGLSPCAAKYPPLHA